MKNAFLIFGATALLIGCAGGGVTTRETSGGTTATTGSSSTGTGGSTTTGSTTTGSTTTGSTTGGSTTGGTTGSTSSGNLSVIPSSTPGKFDVNVLTGIGRAATAFVDIDQISFARNTGGALTSTFTPIRFGLDGYTHDLLTASGPLSPATQTYTDFSFRITKLILPGGFEVDGSTVTSAPLNARTARGRTVTLRLLIDDSMVYEDMGSIVVHEGLFQAANTDPYGGVLAAFYSDFVRFNIGGVTGAPAKYLYLSGDLVAVSEDASPSFLAYFGIGRNLDTVVDRTGTFDGTGSGAYQLDEMDPNDPNNTLKRVEGTWTDASNVLQNIGGFAMIAFPSCDPLAPDHLIMFSMSGGSIDQCYVGELNTGDASFVAYPVGELASQGPSLIGGTVSDTATGGTFTIQFGSKPNSFPDNGSYVRFVR